MDFQFPAGASVGGNHRSPLPIPAGGGHHRPPLVIPTAGGGHHRPPLVIPTAGGVHHRLPLANLAAAYIPTQMHGTFQPNQIPPPAPNPAAAYFPAPMRGTLQPNQIPPPPHTSPSIPTPRSTGFPCDITARKLRKAQIRAEILARESDESRFLEEEVRRELYFERGMSERLREVKRLGLFALAPGNDAPLAEIERGIAAKLRELQNFGLLPSLPAVEPTQAPKYMDLRPENMPSHPISHRPEARVGEMPPLDDNQRVGEMPPLDDNHWVGERPPPYANSYSLEAQVGEKRSPDAEVGETLPFPHNNLSDIGLALRPPGDSVGEHVSETVPKPKRDCGTKRKLAEFKTKKMSGQKAPTKSRNCFQCGQPGHLRANCPASEEAANYKVSQRIDENDMVEEDGAVNDKCSRCGQSGHSRANCHVSEEEAEWYKFIQETSDSDVEVEAGDADGVEVGEAHAPPANKNCFHCGEVGHQRVNCPLSREAKRPKKSHQKRRSNMAGKRNPHAFGASNHICHGCGKIGHLMRECRILKRQARRAERAENMKQKVLANGVEPLPGFGGKCFICGQSGHLCKQCPASREKVARFEDSYLKKKNDKKERKESKKKKAGL